MDRLSAAETQTGRLTGLSAWLADVRLGAVLHDSAIDKLVCRAHAQHARSTHTRARARARAATDNRWLDEHRAAFGHCALDL